MTAGKLALMELCEARNVDYPEQLEPLISEANAKRWTQFYFERRHRLELMLGQVSALLGQLIGIESDPEDWIPGAVKAEQETVTLDPCELARQIALGMGAEVRYK